MVEPVENLSFGITLDKLNISTCNSDWDKCFIDRTSSKK